MKISFQTVIAHIRNPAARRRLLDEGALFLSRLIAIASSVITSGISARALGAEARGIYFYGLVVAASIAQFGNLGMASSNFYYMARDPAQRRAILTGTATVTLLVSGVAVPGFMALTALPQFAAWRVGIGTGLLLLVAASSLLNLTISICLIGEQRHVAAAWIQIVGTFLGIGFCVAALELQPTIAGFTWAVFGSMMIVPAISAAYLLRGRAEPIRLDFLKDWMIYSLRAFPFLILSGFVLRATVFVSKPLLDPVSFGDLSIAYQMFEAMIAVPATVGLVMFPRIVAGNELHAATFKKECVRIVIIGAAVDVVSLITLPFFVPLIFGRAFAPAVPLALLYLPGLLGYSVLSIAGNFVAALRFPWEGLLGWGACILLTGLGAFIGGKFAGGAGIALGTSLGLIVAASLFTIIVLRGLAKWNAARQTIIDQSIVPLP